jgi:hypothetical protein
VRVSAAAAHQQHNHEVYGHLQQSLATQGTRVNSLPNISLVSLTLPLVGSARVSASFNAASLYLRPCTVTPPLPLLLLACLTPPLLLVLLLLLSAVLMLTGSEGLAGSRLALNSHQGSHRPPVCTCGGSSSISSSSTLLLHDAHWNPQCPPCPLESFISMSIS